MMPQVETTFSDSERANFDRDGYVVARNLLDTEYVAYITAECEAALEKEAQVGKLAHLNQRRLLKYEPFLELIEHPALIGRHKAFVGNQVQLLQADLVCQRAGHKGPERAWHRDFSFPGDNVLSVNTIIYLDPMTDDRGPTYVVPGSHRGRALPPEDESKHLPRSDEVPIHAEPGDALFFNSAIWHSGGIINTEGSRRGLYLYYGHWWMKRYREGDLDLPWQSFTNASEQRQRLLGVKMPHSDLHMYPLG
jgi:ectoine hydroxylase-related dioxygenase (phytanoyl-CoA dioxygenase family)